MKKKVLFLMQLPPPVHGASMVNQSIQSSKLINNIYNASYLNISPAIDMQDLGRLSFGKIAGVLLIYLKAIILYFKLRPNLVYLTLSPHGFAFWKDSLILQTLKLFGANLVVHLHGKGIADEIRRSHFRRSVYEAVFKKVNVIHLSKSLFKDIEDVRDFNMGIFEVNNGVNELVSKVTKTRKEITFIYLSNLVPTKGVDTLIEAINILDEKYLEKFRVKIVGKVTDRKFMKMLESKLTDKSKLRVDFCGPLYDSDKEDVLTNSDVFILPTRFKNECFPLSILEAMSSGLPILSTYEGAIPDIVDEGINGYLFSSKNSMELSDCMVKYIDNPDLISVHGKNSRKKFSEKYTQKKFEENLSFVLAQCVE